MKEVQQSMKNNGSLQEKKYALERLLDYAQRPGFLRKKIILLILWFQKVWQIFYTKFFQKISECFSAL